MDNPIRAELIRDRLATTAFAFRGYNNTNLGRTAELLEHRVPTGRSSSGICAKTPRPAPPRRATSSTWWRRVRSRVESSLDTFAEDIPLIVAVERAAHRRC